MLNNSLGRDFSPSSGGQKSEIKVLATLLSSEASLLVLQLALFPLCLTWSSLCTSLS